MSLSLCDLPIELLTTLVFSELSPFDLARLFQVNVQLNNAVCQFLAHIKRIKMPTTYQFPRRHLTAHRRKCFNFMTRHTTHLVSLGDDKEIRSISDQYYWMRNPDLMRVIKKNPKLEIIDVRGVTISHAVLRQLLLCEKLRFLR